MNNSHKLIDQEIHQPLSITRNLFTLSMTVISLLFAAIALLPLFALLFEIIYQGIGKLSWETLVSLPAPVGVENEPNGFANAIVGTITMVLIATLFSVPFGVITGIFLAEFNQNEKIASVIRFVTVILSSVPSVIIGVFAYAVLVITTKKFSAIAGAFGLSIIMLPIIALTTEEALKLIPSSYRLASAALGAGRFRTIFWTVIPNAIPAITTGVLLAVARAAGETAPLIFTALFSQFWQEGLFSPTPSMSVLIYNYASSPFKEQNQLAWTAALILISIVLLTNIISRLFTNKR